MSRVTRISHTLFDFHHNHPWLVFSFNTESVAIANSLNSRSSSSSPSQHSELAACWGWKYSFPVTELSWVLPLWGAVLPFSFPPNQLISDYTIAQLHSFLCWAPVDVPCHFNWSPICGHLGSFHSFTVTCNSAPSKLLHTFLCILRSVCWDKLYELFWS